MMWLLNGSAAMVMMVVDDRGCRDGQLIFLCKFGMRRVGAVGVRARFKYEIFLEVHKVI